MGKPRYGYSMEGEIKMEVNTIIAGKQFSIERLDNPTLFEEGGGGGVVPGNNKIVLFAGLRGKDELEVLAHEATHAHDMELPEDFVEALAKDIANALWDYGYRVEHPELRI